jgi:hypothetical protein
MADALELCPTSEAAAVEVCLGEDEGEPAG